MFKYIGKTKGQNTSKRLWHSESICHSLERLSHGFFEVAACGLVVLLVAAVAQKIYMF